MFDTEWIKVIFLILMCLAIFLDCRGGNNVNSRNPSSSSTVSDSFRNDLLLKRTSEIREFISEGSGEDRYSEDSSDAIICRDREADGEIGE